MIRYRRKMDRRKMDRTEKLLILAALLAFLGLLLLGRAAEAYLTVAP